MDTSFIITFIGDDRPGLVEELSAVISEQQGNWQESQLSQLAGKFAGLIQVSLPSNRGPDLEQALKALSAKGLSVRVHPIESGSEVTTPLRGINLSILGPDRPGIVREVSAALAARNINVVELESNVESAPMSAEMLFRASVEAQVSEDSDVDDLGDALEDIANQMLLDIQLESAP